MLFNIIINLNLKRRLLFPFIVLEGQGSLWKAIERCSEDMREQSAGQRDGVREGRAVRQRWPGLRRTPPWAAAGDAPRVGGTR